MISSLEKKINWLIYVFFLFVSVIFMIIAPFSTSPLYDNFGSDSAIFMLIGRSILHGKIPYIDIFDHKGPVIFFIQALCQGIYSGRMGIWVIEIVCCFISLIIIFKLSLLFMKWKIALVIPIAYIFFIALTFNEGNLTEEYSMPLCYICIYLTTKYMLSEIGEHPPKYSFLYGICFMIIVLMRMNNAIAIVGAVLIIIINLMVKRKFYNLLMNAFAFSLGCIVILGPISVYFISHNAFGEMIRGTFTFNYKYALSKEAVKTAKQLMTYQIKAILPTLTGIIGSMLYWHKNHKVLLPSMLILISVLTYSSVGLGQCFKHYLMLASIPFVFGLILLFSSITFNLTYLAKTFLSVLCILAVLCTFIIYIKDFGVPYFNILRYEYNSSYNSNAILLSSNIPNDERESVSGYNTNSSWFMAVGINPCTRYFTLQDWMALFDPSIKEEVELVLHKTPPKWMVVTNFSKIKNNNIKIILEEQYVKIAEVVDDGIPISLYMNTK